MRKLNIKNFANEKKLCLMKLDKSKKGSIDEKIISLLELINSKNNYYTTSSCSGRVMLWSGTGKKNETEWVRVSHELIDDNFLKVEAMEDKLVWLRFEPFILHVCCKDLAAAEKFLELAHKVYKKSSILSISNKIIVEVKGSEFIEMPLYAEGELLLKRDLNWLVELVNKKMREMWMATERFKEIIS